MYPLRIKYFITCTSEFVIVKDVKLVSEVLLWHCVRMELLSCSA